MSTPLRRAAHAVAAELTRVGVGATGVDVCRGPRVASLRVHVQGDGAHRALRMEGLLARACQVPRVRVVPTSAGVTVEVPLPRSMWRPVTASDVRGTAMTVGLGVTPAGRTLAVSFDAPETPHLLVVGATGSGKTEAVRAVVWQLAMGNDPERLGLLLVDAKGDGLAPFARLPHLLRPVIDDPDEAAAALDHVASTMRRRDRSSSRAHRTVVVIDELADIIDATGGAEGRAGRALRRIATMGRGCGVHAVLATQLPRADTVGRHAAANVRARLVGACADGAASRLCTGLEDGAGSAARLLGGQGDMLYVEGGRVRRVQAPMVTADEWAMLPMRTDHPEPIPTGDPDPHPEAADVARVVALWDGTGMPGIMRIRRELGCGDSRARRLRDAAAAMVGDPGIPAISAWPLTRAHAPEMAGREG